MKVLLLDVALVVLDIVLMLVATATARRHRPRRASLAAALYGVAIVVTLVVLVRMIGQVGTDLPPLEVLGLPLLQASFSPVIWAAMLYVQVRTYQMWARASFEGHVWDAASRRWVPGRSFVAVLLPLDIPAAGGPPGRLAGGWSVRRGGAPVWIDDPDTAGGRRLVGRVDDVWVEEGPRAVYGSGVIADGTDLAGRLPEVSFLPLHRGRIRHQAGPVLFPAARIMGVKMGRHAAFDGLWVNYYDREGREP